MSHLTHLAVLFPTIAMVIFVDAQLKNENYRRQLKTGAFVLATGTVPAIALFLIVPGGSLSKLPPDIALQVEFVSVLAIAAITGTMFVAMILISRGLWGSRQKDPDEGS